MRRMPAASAASRPSPEDGAERRERASGFAAPPSFWRQATPAEALLSTAWAFYAVSAMVIVFIGHFGCRVFHHWSQANRRRRLDTLAEQAALLMLDIDRCARWGGEEFLLLLPQQDLAGALACAERIRQQLAARRTQPP